MKKYIYLLSSLLVILTIILYTSGNVEAYQSGDDISCSDICNDVCFTHYMDPCTYTWCSFNGEPAQTWMCLGKAKHQTIP